MSKTTRSLGVSASLALALAASPAFGAAFQGSAYEGFTGYTAGAMTATHNGGTGWNATGDANLANTTSWGVGTNLAITNQGASIQSSGLVGNSAVVSGATASSSIGRQFGQTVDSGTFYFSFLTQRTNNEFRTVNFSFFSATNERLAIGQIAANPNTRDQEGNWLSNAGQNSGNFAALISNSQNNTAAATTVGPAAHGVYVNTTSPAAYSSTVTTRIVGKIEFNFAEGVEDRLTLYVNPGDLLNEPSLVSSYLVIDHNDFGALTGFRIFSGTTGGGFNASGAQFDEIRFGTNYLSVTGAAIPEPSSYAALLGLAGLGFAALRRRRA